MKLIQNKAFTPYQIQVETQAEHDFLVGQAEGGRATKKQACENYNLTIDNNFYVLLKNV